MKRIDGEEKNQYSYFSQQYGEEDGNKYYYCQQDGPRRAKVTSNQTGVELEEENSGEVDATSNEGLTSKRRKKSCNKKGRMKTGFNCIAMMTVLKMETGEEVQYFPTHNHPQYEADLKHQPLTEATNSCINKHILAYGASAGKIIKTLRGDKFSRVNRESSELKLTRNEFITIKALRERKRKMAAEKSLHSDDSQAVYMQMQLLREEDFNPILIYKPEGQKLVYGPESANNLPLDVFMLGLQTEEQEALMKMASQSILIVDATHDMDQYGHKLLNVVRVDELNRGYPLAHLISSKMDEHTIKYFFEALHLRMPDMDVNCVITDDDPALINSMNLGFGQLIRHILCDWHFKRTIQGQLHSKVNEIEVEDQMFKELCVLIDCDQEADFNLI
ncbi:Antitoxin [Frankliniella fusca]|uniref:Antitoxin n=1 Tax=Frankliniella fusca TaxID=407009 RepID=A0AAE1HWY3_9NEOP|nr:Antitoxin [Frankliniella fusca]